MSEVKRISVFMHGPNKKVDMVEAAHFDRVAAERDALLAGLDAKDQQAASLEKALKFYADREHYHFESGNWDTVSGEPLNILWNGDEPDFIEDGSVARAALNPTPKPHTCCGSYPAGCIGAKP